MAVFTTRPGRAPANASAGRRGNAEPAGAERSPLAGLLGLLATLFAWAALFATVAGVGLLLAGLAMAAGGQSFSAPAGIGEIGWEAVALALPATLVIGGGTVFIALTLRAVLATLAKGDPFVPANATRLTRIALAVAAIQLTTNAVQLGFRALTGYDEALDLAPVTWLSVLVLLVMAQVFREGTRLREEERLTV